MRYRQIPPQAVEVALVLHRCEPPGLHAGNHSVLPLFDIVLGTWHNPRDFAPEQGFHSGASSRYGPKLPGRDVASRVVTQEPSS